jgi:hypothetical protein
MIWNSSFLQCNCQIVRRICIFYLFIETCFFFFKKNKSIETQKVVLLMCKHWRESKRKETESSRCLPFWRSTLYIVASWRDNAIRIVSFINSVYTYPMICAYKIQFQWYVMSASVREKKNKQQNKQQNKKIMCASSDSDVRRGWNRSNLIRICGEKHSQSKVYDLNNRKSF